jgi:hypothetical protein
MITVKDITAQDNKRYILIRKGEVGDKIQTLKYIPFDLELYRLLIFLVENQKQNERERLTELAKDL